MKIKKFVSLNKPIMKEINALCESRIDYENRAYSMAISKTPAKAIKK